MRYLKFNKKKKIFLILYISLFIFSSLESINTFYIFESNDSLSSNDEMEFNLSDVQFDLKSLPKWKEQNSKADKNENGIDDNFEVRLKELSEFGFIEENFDRDKENLDKNNIYDDIFKNDIQKTEKITIDDIPIIIYFPNGDYNSISLLFETLGGKIKSTYKAALNGFAGRISYNPLNEFCDLLIQNGIPFFIEEDMVYEAQLYYAGRNMNLRPYVWNTLSYDGDEYSSIAIVDTGIDDSHNFATPGYADADFNYKIVGWRDEVNGLTSPYDDNGHGSHCSGISAGEGSPNYDGTGRTVATAAYEWDYTGWDVTPGSYLYNWARFNVTDPGLIELFCEFDDFTPGLDDVDFWAYLYYGETIVDSHEVASDSWSHTLSYTATSSSLGLYSFRYSMNLIDNTGDGYVSDFNFRFRSEMHWPFSPNLFGSGDAWKGVAPDAHLVGVKVLDQYGSGWSSDIIDGINWVITNKNAYNITTMSLSLGGSSGQLGMITAVNNAVENGIVTVVSAGNSGPGGNNVGSPGDADNVITVAAMNIYDETTDYSSQGGLSYTGNTVKPDITAPGGSLYDVQMFSTDTNDNDAEGAYPTDGYANDMAGMQGTSMSAPAVAGASNLLIEAMGGHQSWSYTGTEAKHVKALLLMSATETYPLLREMDSGTYSPQLNRGGKDVHEGYGRLNVDIAIEAYTQELVLGSTQNAWIASSFDNPFSKHGLGCYVNLIEGKSYNFTLDVPVGADFDLHLYSNNPTSIGEPIMVASSTSSGLGTDEIIFYTATETGKYYLVAKAISGEGNAIISSSIIAHDLSVSLEVPTNPEISQTYIVDATVTNTGINDEIGVNLFLYLDDILVNSTTLPSLPAGANETINYMWTPNVYKTYNFTAYVPPVPGETHIVDNIATELIIFSTLHNYTMIIDYEYNWIDASGGTELLLSDDGYSNQPLPFNFQFYNETFSTIYLGANGYLSFTDISPSEYSNDPIPSGDLESYYLIAPFWDDLRPASGGGSGNIFVQSFGTYWVAEWLNIYHYSAGPVVGSFEVILYESGDIVFNYDYISYTGGGYTCGLNLGADVQYYNSYQGINDLTDNFTIFFTYEQLNPPGDFILSSNAGTPDDNGAFDLSWTSAVGAQNYSVYEYSSYITEINGSLTLLGDGITDLSLALSGYTNGTYYFIVVAHNAYGDKLSNCIEVVVEILPQTPGNFVLSSNAGTPDDNGAFDLSWTSAAGAQNYSVYEYLSYITEINGSLTLLGDGITDLSLALSGYTDGTYYFIVVAHNNYGDTLSNCIEVVVGIPPGDFILSSNAGTPDDNGAFDLSWTSAVGAQNYSVYEYSSYITEINGSLTLLGDGITDLFHALSRYTNGTYYFIVVANNTYGDALSNCIEVVVEILPQPPGNFVLSSNAGTPDDNGAFDLSWTSAVGAQNYSVYEYSSYITEINGSLTLLGDGITDFSRALSDYTDGTYYFIVVAHNDYGDTLSNCIEVVVQIPPPPGNFVLSSNAGTPDDNGAFDLSWTSAVGALTYSVYQYSSYITEINGSLTLLGAGITDLSLALSGYTDGTYYFIVVAHNAYGDTLSNCIEVVVQIPEPEPTPPGIPGYNLYVVISMICIVSIILFKKRYKLNNN